MFLQEEHATTVLKLTSHQDELIRKEFTNQLENKVESSSSQSKKRVYTIEKIKEATQDTDEDIVQKETLNSVTETSKIFRDV